MMWIITTSVMEKKSSRILSSSLISGTANLFPIHATLNDIHRGFCCVNFCPHFFLLKSFINMKDYYQEWERSFSYHLQSTYLNKISIFGLKKYLLTFFYSNYQVVVKRNVFKLFTGFNVDRILFIVEWDGNRG